MAFVDLLPLALADSVSVATLAIPIWFLLAPGKPRYGLIWVYLLVVAALYWVLGVGLLMILPSVSAALETVVTSDTGHLIRAVVGCSLMLFAAWYGLVHRPRERRTAGVLGRLREGAVGRAMLVAVVGVSAEIVTMVPYLAAISRLDAAHLPLLVSATALLGYGLVMIAPAAVLIGSAMVLRARMDKPLEAVESWLRRNAQENTAWLIALLGFIIFAGTQQYDDLMAFLS